MKVDIMPTERGLIGVLLAKIQKLDPDVLVVRKTYLICHFLCAPYST